MQATKKFRKLPKFFYRWHRRIGASAAIFFIWIVTSGWLLNHSERFQLNQIEIQNASLAAWYNLPTENPERVFITQTHWLASTHQQWFFDGQPRAFSDGSIESLAETKNMLGVLTDKKLVLLDRNGELVDTINTETLPLIHPTQLGSGCGPENSAALVISNGENNFYSEDGLSWYPCNESSNFIKYRSPSDLEIAQLKKYLIPKISLEKLIIDLHTGRFFGIAGVYTVDFLGLCLILLAASGLWLFLRGQKKL